MRVEDSWPAASERSHDIPPCILLVNCRPATIWPVWILDFSVHDRVETNTEVVCCLWKKREGREEKEKKRQERGEKREGSGRERRKRGTSRASKLVIRDRLSNNALTSNLEPEGLRPGTEERSFHLLWCRRVCVQILKKKPMAQCVAQSC